MARPALAKTTPRRVPAVEKTVLLIKALGDRQREAGVSELARLLGLNKSTVYQILVTLEHFRWVEQNPLTKRYSLGYGLVTLVSQALNQLDLRRWARPWLEELRNRTGETAILHVPDGESSLILDREESLQELKVVAPVGKRLPPFAGSVAKVFLASLPDAVLEERLGKGKLPAFTPMSITSPQAFREELLQVRQRGYALDREEYLPGVWGVSAPIRDSEGNTIAAITVAGVSARMSPEKMEEVITGVVNAAEEVSKRRGPDQAELSRR